MTYLILPYANTKMMNLFLAQVAAAFAEYFIILQAGVDIAKLLPGARSPKKTAVKAF